MSDGDVLEKLNIDCIVLPGVGAVGQALKNLRIRGFQTALNKMVIENKMPFCGICVGMQILCETSDEFGFNEGFGWIPGHVEQLKSVDLGLKLPHVGWNTISMTNPNDPIFGRLNAKDFYFTHSFTLRCPDSFVLAKTEYGENFISAVRRDNIVGVQFHPEKSSHAGAAFLSQFVLNAESLSRVKNA